MPSPIPAYDVLDFDTASSFHLLVVGDDVEPEEIDILAEQIWPRSARLGSGLLELTAEAYLTGPWCLTPETVAQLGLAPQLTCAYLISVPALRGKPVPQWMWGRDPLWDAFKEGGPEGLELEVLNGMRRMARRLAGALRFSTGSVLAPNPDSAVSMRVFSEVWLEPAAGLKVVRQVLPQARLDAGGTGEEVGSVDPGVQLSTSWERANYDPDGLRARIQKGISEDERAWLHAEAEAFDEAAMSMPQILDAYAIRAEVTDMSEVHVVVSGETVVPPILGHREDGCVSYSICWVAPDMELTELDCPPLPYRQERTRILDIIEQLARALAESTDGVAVDADDFVVSW